MFSKMLLDYGKKFTDMWQAADSDELIAHWANELAGYTGPEIARGLAALDMRDWPPTLPEFKKMCRPPVDPVDAYWEAVAGLSARAAGRMGVWSHPAIFWAASALAAPMGEQPFAVIRARWERALGDSLAQGQWQPIPDPMAALPAPGKASTSKEEAQRRLRELGASGLLKRCPTPGEGKQWARRLLDRAAAGDQRIEWHPVQCAKQTLAAA